VLAAVAGVGQQPGSITVDERTHSFIALESQDRLVELRRIVTQLDIPVRQVMIEARIVEANVGFDKALGVRWGGNVRLGGRFNTYGGTGESGIDITDDPILSRNPETGEYDVENFRNPGGIFGNTVLPFNTPFVDMGVAGATSGIGIG